jgi:lipid II:glycine glycyltransferase (peptidoglycan interpeptide bridge formation enzyme)
MFSIKETKNKTQWEDFILSQNEPPFLQSWYWGEFHQSLGDKIFRLGIFDNEEIVGAALVIRVLARRGAFLFLPYGPTIKMKNGKIKMENDNVKCKNIQNEKYEDLKIDVFKTLTDYLKDLAKEEKCCFVRISPNWEKNKDNVKILKDLKFREAPIHLKPETTWLLDITPDEEKILKGMRKTTRNLIRRGYRENIQIIKSENPDDLDEFYKIYQKTVERQNFIPFSKEYLKKEFSVFIQEKKIALFFAKHKGEFLAASLFIFYGNQGFYHHSASLRDNSKIPTSYLLLWEAIKEAKKRNCKFFNFWGIAPPDKSKHPWQGLTLFKKGFGGYQKDLVRAQDLPINSRYWINWAIETFRRIKRGY